ncbi:MAG: sodium:solute symporter family protein [Saprospiraceae bacterium]|nr:sodium:solute symporter family protein [Saprospiraceae bacterium]
MLTLFIGLYLIITILIGFYAHTRITGGADFINAGRNLHPVVNAFALFALWFGSETLFGASTEFAQHGLSGIIEDPLGGVLCLLLVGFFYARKMFRLNALTIGDLFYRNYGPKVAMIASGLMVISFLGYIAAQLLALGLILNLLTSFPLFICMLFSLMLILTYTMLGGMLAVSLTDFFQSLMIILGLAVIAWYLTREVGDVKTVINTIPPGHWRFFPENTTTEWINWLAAWMALGLGSIVSQDVFQRVNSARSEHAAHLSTLIGAILYGVISLLPLYIIMAVKLTHPDTNEANMQMTLPAVVLTKMPMFVKILFFGSVVSAILSTCSGAVLAPASLLSENVLKPLFFKNLSDQTLLKLTRISIVVVGIIAVFVAHGSEKIFDLVGESSAFGVVSILVPYTAALFLNYTNRLGAFSAMFCGTLTWAVTKFIIKTTIDPTIYGFCAALLGIALATLVTRFFTINPTLT